LFALSQLSVNNRNPRRRNLVPLAIKASATLDQLKSNKMRNNIFTHTFSHFHSLANKSSQLDTSVGGKWDEKGAGKGEEKWAWCGR